MTLKEKLSEFWRQISGSVVKTAFYVSRKTFWAQLFFQLVNSEMVNQRKKRRERFCRSFPDTLYLRLKKF